MSVTWLLCFIWAFGSFTFSWSLKLIAGEALFRTWINLRNHPAPKRREVKLKLPDMEPDECPAWCPTRAAQGSRPCSGIGGSRWPQTFHPQTALKPELPLMSWVSGLINGLSHLSRGLTLLREIYFLLSGVAAEVNGPSSTLSRTQPTMGESWWKERMAGGPNSSSLSQPLPISLWAKDAWNPAALAEPALYWLRSSAFLFFFSQNLLIWKYWVLVVACRIFSCGKWDLIPQPGIEPSAPSLGVWSLNPWTTW